MNSSATFLASCQNIGSEVEISTIEKQRKELQLLIGELKDRDRELNDMVAVHQRQLLSWEEDRQKVLTLEERCSKLEGELHKRSEIIRSLIKKVKSLESNQNECQMALQKTQQQLQEMAQKATHASLLSEDLEARNLNLSNTLVDLSAQVGQLQAREQALTTMIKLKDKDIIEAVNHIADCSGKFKLLEHALRDAKMMENSIVKEKQDYKQKLKALKVEIGKLKVEREKRKDDLLDIAKSKQERTNAELHNLRQIYVKQQRDLQFLHFNVENSQELIQLYDSKMEEPKALESSGDMCLSDLENSHSKADVEREKDQKLLVKDQKFETMLVQQNRSDESSYDVRKGKKLRANASPGERSVTAISSLFAKDSVGRQKPWSLGGKIQIEPENKSTLCKIHAKSAKDIETGILNSEKQLSESSLSEEKQWHDFSVYLGLASCSGSKPPEKLNGECQDQRDRPEVSYCQNNEACLSESDVCDESRCCHPSNLIIEAPGHMSDIQWMSMFKPCKVERIVRHKSACTCSESVSGAKYNSSPSEPLVTVHHSACLGSSSSTLRGDEKFIEADFSPDRKNSSKTLLTSQGAALPSEKKCTSRKYHPVNCAQPPLPSDTDSGSSTVCSQTATVDMLVSLLKDTPLCKERHVDECIICGLSGNMLHKKPSNVHDLPGWQIEISFLQ
ncbi:coiled-coil domain-containing protein 62 isoform X3 [Elephas maximus indicus]|uniref:coiled-coil domain-containing protein 62 isoform X3 n=1 Tax=Elephas maximus indicus TaxID=99487 RepID=UPI002116AE58|nr:coiled-coil domain-containing protein 62 isoform X3 [Elephas maximus indicus]